MTLLVDDDLTLRPWQPTDAESVYRARQDPDIQRWNRIRVPYEMRDAEQFVASSYEGHTRLGVFETGSGALLGSVSLSMPVPGVRGLGFWTAPWARGKAVAERAGRLAVAWAFETQDLRRLKWEAKVGNHASRMVAARLGVTIEGVERAAAVNRDGTPADLWVGSLLPGELRPAGPDGARLRRAARQARTFGSARPRLTAGDATLRPLTEADIPDIIESCDDEAMARYTTIPQPYGRGNAEFFLALGSRAWLAGTGVYLAIEHQGRYSGAIDLRLGTWPDRVAEVGYSVAPWARGHGLAATALRALCRWAFDALALDRIEWRALVGNIASRRTAQNVGFTVEGTQRGGMSHGTQPVDTWYGALLATDL